MTGIPPGMGYLWQGIGFGFLAGVTIGPFLGYVINVVMLHGWRRSLPLISIPPLVDAPIIFVTVFLLGQFPAAVSDLLSILGGSFTVWLAWSTWRQNRRSMQNLQLRRQNPHETIEFPRLSVRGSYLRGMMVNLLSPAPYLFWSTVSGPILIDALDAGGAASAFSFIVGYYAMFLALIYGLIRLVDRAGKLDDRVNRWLMPATIALMVVLGAGLVIAGVWDITRPNA